MEILSSPKWEHEVPNYQFHIFRFCWLNISEQKNCSLESENIKFHILNFSIKNGGSKNLHSMIMKRINIGVLPAAKWIS